MPSMLSSAVILPLLFYSVWSNVVCVLDYTVSTRGDQKVLQLPTLVNKMVKINGWVTISKY